MTLTSVLSALGLAPKTLPQATETITEARTALDSVSALFTAAGLNLEQMLAVGPDALKAHLESIDNAEELATALAEAERLDTALTETQATLALRDSTLAAVAETFAAIGLDDITNQAPAAGVKSKFEAHVAKQTTLALAKTGHPPAHVPASVETVSPSKSDAELYAEYSAMPIGAVRLDFFSKHEAALKRAVAGKK